MIKIIIGILLFFILSGIITFFLGCLMLASEDKNDITIIKKED